MPEREHPFILSRSGDGIEIELSRPIYFYQCSDELMTVVKPAGGTWQGIQDDRLAADLAVGLFYLDDAFIGPIVS